MGSTRSCKPQGDQVTYPFCPSESPGCLGIYDRADPNAQACYGDSPGSVGLNDMAAAQAGVYYDEEQVCTSDYYQKDALYRIGDARLPNKKAETGAEAEAEADADVYVIRQDLFLRFARETANYAATTLDINTLGQLLSDFGYKGNKFYIKTYKGAEYIVLKGYPGLRKMFTGTKYMSNNTKVLSMAVGRKGLAYNAAKGGVITIVLIAAVDVAEYFLNDEVTFTHLGVNLFGDVSKAAIAAAAGFAVSKLVLIGFAGTVAAPLAAGIVVAIAVGVGLDWLDREFGISEKLQKMLSDELDRWEWEILRTMNAYNPSTVRGYNNLRRAFGGGW